MLHRIAQSGAAVALALTLLAPGAVAVGAAGWVLPAAPLAPANGPSGAVVALDPAGDAVAAWTDDDGRGTQSLLVATRPAGGAWSAPTPLASDVGVDAPAVTIDAAGNATVVWIESPGGTTSTPRAARRDAASGTWGAPHDLFVDLTGSSAADPQTQVRADAAGNVVAAWVSHDVDTGVASVLAAVADAAGNWGTATVLSDPSDATVAFGRPRIAPDASDGALVGWTAQRIDDPAQYAVQTSRHLGGGAWSAPVDLVTTSGEAISPLRLVGLDGGDAAATWFQGSPPTLWGALRTDGTWTVDDVSADVAPGCEPLQALGADAAGASATVVWKAASSDGLESVRLTAGGWEPQATVFAARTDSAEDVAVDRGTVALVAHDAATDADSLLASRREDGGGWSGPVLLDGPAPADTALGDLDVAGDATGDAAVSWIATDALGGKSVLAATYTVDRPPPPPPPPPGDGTTPGGGPSTGGGTSSSGGGTAGGGSASAPSAALLRPRISAPGGVLLLRTGSRTLALVVRNPNGALLRGSVTLVRPRGAGGRAALTLASRRRVAFAADRSTTVALRLTDQALRVLRTAAGHRQPVRVALRLRTPGGRLATASRTATLDAAPRFGAGRVHVPTARTSC